MGLDGVRRTVVRVRRVAWCVGVIGMLALAGHAHAGPQSMPVTQSSDLHDTVQRMLRYYQQQLRKTLQAPVNPLSQPQATPAASTHANGPSGKEFVLTKVVFTPSKLLDPAALQAAVKPFIGRRIGQNDLKKLLASVNALYISRKITTARAVFPSQNIGADGVIHVKLVEGRLGKLIIHGARNMHRDFIRRRVPLKEGDVIDPGQLRRELVYINRTTDLDVKALLAPGSGYGQTNVLMSVAEPSWRGIDVFVDNNGTDSTGRLEEGVAGHLYNLFGLDDRLSGNIVHSSGGIDGALSYSIPLTPDNDRLGVSYARSRIDIINGAFRNLHIVGHSSVASLSYSLPFIASLHWKLAGIGSYSVSKSTTSVSGKQIANTRNRSINLGINLSHESDGQRWGVVQLITRVRSDEPMLGESHFVLGVGRAYFMQRLGKSRWTFGSDASWQFSSNDNMPSASLFQIGGLGSVRGYRRGVLAGPRGYYLDVEIHRSFGDHLDIYGFADHGTVYAFYPTDKNITGAGVGGVYRYHDWLSVSADVAKPLSTVEPDQRGVRADFRVAVHWQ